MYANGHIFVRVSHTKKACHSLSVCVWGVCALCSGTCTCVHIWRLEEDNGYPVISPLVLFLGWDLLLNLELACQPISPPCSSCFCLPKHQDCKHTWPHLTAYIGAGNLNSSPHGSAALLPIEPFLQPHKIHVVVFYLIPLFIHGSECQEPAISDLQKVTWRPSEQKPRNTSHQFITGFENVEISVSLRFLFTIAGQTSRDSTRGGLPQSSVYPCWLFRASLATGERRLHLEWA